jgi:predicted transcriptional regulator
VSKTAEQIKTEIAKLAKDGRWRTAKDFATKIKASDTAITGALTWMHYAGLLEREAVCHNIKTYRKAGAAA